MKFSFFKIRNDFYEVHLENVREKNSDEYRSSFPILQSINYIEDKIILSAIMIQSICLVFLLRIFITADCSTNISFIYSAVYVPVNASNVSLYYGTCSECICYAFFSNIQFTYEALNCYDNNRTCSLFPSFSSQSNIRIDTNSKIAFIRQSSSTAGNSLTSFLSPSHLSNGKNR